MAEVLCCVTLGVVNFYVGLKKIRKKDILGTTVIKGIRFCLEMTGRTCHCTLALPTNSSQRLLLPAQTRT